MEKTRFKVVFTKIAETHFSKLPKSVQLMVKKAIEQRLMVDPVGFGKPLQYSLKGHKRLRINAYRVVYKLNYEERLVTIVAIGHRKDIYDDC